MTEHVMEQASEPWGKYLYSIVRSSGDRCYEGAAAIGNPRGGVYTVCHDGLAMVVSDATFAEYPTTRTNLLAHERVQERVLQECTVLPVRFGTVASGEEPAAARKIRNLLEKRSPEFHRLLADMEGSVELGVKALWRDQERVFEEIVARYGDIRRLRDALRDRPFAATHFDRARLGEMVRDALGRAKEADAAVILAPLRRLARRVVENNVVLDRMVVNAAFLVEGARQQDFDDAVANLDAELGNRIQLKYVGAVPPYNFVNITVNWKEL